MLFSYWHSWRVILRCWSVQTCTAGSLARGYAKFLRFFPKKELQTPEPMTTLISAESAIQRNGSPPIQTCQRNRVGKPASPCRAALRQEQLSSQTEFGHEEND